MTKPRGADPAGRPVDLVGQPLQPGRGSVPGVVIVKEIVMGKADKAGRYELDGHYYRIRKGDTLPPGATMVEPGTDAKPEERAQQAAPENKSRKAAPEAK